MTGRPNIGAYTGTPDIGAWQFPQTEGVRPGALRSDPVLTGAVESAAALTGKLGNRVVTESEFGADQS